MNKKTMVVVAAVLILAVSIVVWNIKPFATFGTQTYAVEKPYIAEGESQTICFDPGFTGGSGCTWQGFTCWLDRTTRIDRAGDLMGKRCFSFASGNVGQHKVNCMFSVRDCNAVNNINPKYNLNYREIFLSNNLAMIEDVFGTVPEVASYTTIPVPLAEDIEQYEDQPADPIVPTTTEDTSTSVPTGNNLFGSVLLWLKANPGLAFLGIVIFSLGVAIYVKKFR